MSPNPFARLAGMMFLLYFAAGAILPILSHYLKNYLEFEPFRAGVVLAMPAVAAIFAPLWVNLVADRYLRSERVLAVCQLTSAVLMLLLWGQSHYLPFLLIFLGYSLLFMPCMALTNTVTFHHVADANRQFAPIRTWGTIGWFTVAWVFGYFWLQGGSGEIAGSRLDHALLVSGLTSLLLGLYALTLPRPHAGPEGGAEVAKPWDGVSVYTDRSLVVLCVAAFLNSVLNQFYAYGIGPFLSASGFGDQWIMPALSLGQLVETCVMAVMAFWLGRWSFKTVLVLGNLFQILRFVIFAVADSPGALLFGISLHGCSYTFFFVTAYIYIDNHCRPIERAGAQQTFHIIVAGIGVLTGSLLAGGMGELATPVGAEEIYYPQFWMAPLGLAILLFVFMLTLFRETPSLVRARTG